MGFLAGLFLFVLVWILFTLSSVQFWNIMNEWWEKPVFFLLIALELCGILFWIMFFMGVIKI